MPKLDEAHPPKAKPRRLATVAALAALGALGACHKETAAAKPLSPPVKIEAAQVSVGPVTHVLDAVGSLSSPQDTIVASQIAGKVVALDIRQGQFVKQGDVLVRLDDALEKAALQSAEAALANARQIYDRDQRVLRSGAVSAQAVGNDLATLRQAQAAVDQAKVNLSYTRIRAPFTGVLGLRQVSLGAYLTPGLPIVDIQQMNPLHLDFALPQQDVSKVKEGQTVHFTVAGYKQSFAGTVTTVTQGLMVGSRSLSLQATVPNPAFQLKPGMFASIDLVVGVEPKAMLIPEQAVVPEGQINTVWVVGPNDTVRNQTVTLGVYHDNMVQVLKGLAPGARVVTAGVQKIHTGTKVVVAPFEPIRNPRLDFSAATARAAPPSIANGGNSAQ